MIFGRALGWALLVLGLVVLGRDLWAWLAGLPFERVTLDELRPAAGSVPLRLGELWVQIHSGSLLLLQPAVERYISPWLWQAIIQPVLEWPAAAVLAGLGTLLLVVFGRRRPVRRDDR